MTRYFLFLPALLLATFSAGMAQAQDASSLNYVITLQNDAFSPKKLEVPAGQKIKLTVKNMQSSPAEFESSELGREKVVGANSEITVKLGPLTPGDYIYFNDFHHDTNGTITAK